MSDTSNVQREPDFALIPALSPTIERVHAVRDFVAALVHGHIAYEAAVNKGIQHGHERRLQDRGGSREHTDQ